MLRSCLGLSYEQCGEVLAVNASTINTWERNQFRPSPNNAILILARWESLPESLKNKKRKRNFSRGDGAPRAEERNEYKAPAGLCRKFLAGR